MAYAYVQRGEAAHRQSDDVGAVEPKVVEDGDDVVRAAKPLRNHGLFSKAERALQIAGWSERARNDIEIFRLVDTEGLTPLLMVLNEPGARSEPRAPTEARVA